MYGERTRQLQAYSSFLATIEKEKKDAINQALTEGIAEGKLEGVEHGKKMMIISLIKDGLLSKEEGAKRLSISVIELDEYLSSDEQQNKDISRRPRSSFFDAINIVVLSNVHS